MTTRLALKDLGVFNSNPTVYNASRLVNIPALYDVLKYEETCRGYYPAALLAVCQWLCERGCAVLEKLIIYTPPPVHREAGELDGDWKQVS
jgi:hypothetical protein